MTFKKKNHFGKVRKREFFSRFGTALALKVF